MLPDGLWQDTEMRSLMKRFWKICMIPLVLLVILTGIFFGARIRTVKVEGSRIYSDQQIIQSAMADKYAYHSLYFLIESRIRGVKCLPFTQEIEVEWHGISSITLHVYDKTISGCVKYMGQYIYFDKDGIVLQSLNKTMDGVPVVTGIKFGKFAINQAFDVDDDTLFETIMNLSQLISHYQVAVDQIQFKGKKVYLYSGKVKVSLGEKSFYDDDMAALSSVLAKTSEKKLSGTINMERFQPGDKIILKTNDPVDSKSNDTTAQTDAANDTAAKTDTAEDTQ